MLMTRKNEALEVHGEFGRQEKFVQRWHVSRKDKEQKEILLKRF